MSKRLFDLVCIIVSLPLLLPVTGLVAFLVRRNLGTPVFFSQVRPGLHGKPFKMYKFRSMTSECDENGELLPDEKRLPPFGVRLRSSSLDELPELWNVLRGDMSLVGPRPLLMEYLPLYSEEQKRRHEMLPGVTGWSQVNGRNSLSWEEKFRLDNWYVDHHSVLLDFKILLLTVAKVLKRDGITAEGTASMPKFQGSDEAVK